MQDLIQGLEHIGKQIWVEMLPQSLDYSGARTTNNESEEPNGCTLQSSSTIITVSPVKKAEGQLYLSAELPDQTVLMQVFQTTAAFQCLPVIWCLGHPAKPSHMLLLLKISRKAAWD